VDKCDETVTL